MVPYIRKEIYDIGDVVLERNQKIDNFYIILKGCVRLIYDDEDCQKFDEHDKIKKNLNYKKQFFLRTLSEGEYFG